MKVEKLLNRRKGRRLRAMSTSTAPEVFAYRDFRAFLKAILQFKSETNPSFSLRAFAKYLGLSPTNLSEVMRSKRGLSPDRAAMISKKICTSSKERKFFEMLVQLDSAKTESLRNEIRQKIEQFEPDLQFESIQHEQFKLIADWYHLTLMTLVNLNQFSALNPEEVCKQLGISILQYENAMERLRNLGLIVNEQGKWKANYPVIRVQSTEHNLYLKRFHEQLLEKASTSIRTHEAKNRFSASDVLVLDQEGLKQAGKILDSAINRIYSLSLKGKKEQVVALSVHAFTLFPKDKA